MRVDFEKLLPLLRGSELYKRFRIIAEWEKYTLLTPPYAGDAVKELFGRAQQELAFRFVREYYWFLKCCDGGLLFSNHLYSLLAPDAPEDDLVEVNGFLRDSRLIPPGSAAIGETNYGGYIVQCESGRKAMGIWDPDEGAYVARFEDLYAWLDDAIREAEYLLANDALFEIEDEDEPEAGSGAQDEGGDREH